MRIKFLSLMLVGVVVAASKKPQLPPVFDPPDQPFRMAPMPLSSRSIYVPLSKNLHLAFDVERCRVHTVWQGGPLKMFGPSYHGAKRPFICQPNGERYWGNPPFFPWSTNPDITLEGFLKGHQQVRFVAVSTKGEAVTFMYDLLTSDNNVVRIHESVKANKWLQARAVVRRYEVGGRKQALYLQAHVEKGKAVKLGSGNITAIQRRNDVLVVVLRGAKSLRLDQESVDLDYVEEIYTEEGTTKGNPIEKIKGQHSVVSARIPPSKNPSSFEIISAVVSDLTAAKKLISSGAGELPVELPQMKFLTNRDKDLSAPVVKTFDADPKTRRSFSRSPYYEVEPFPMPAEMNMLVTGMDWLPNGNLALATYAGEVYIVQDAQGPVTKAVYRRFARGMCEPLGLLVKDGKIHLGNKNEITRLTDTDDNGEADLFESVNNGWDYTGSYNSFSYGPILDKDGNFVVANAGHAGRWSAKYMGWALRISPDGSKLDPICSGMREPNGIGTFGPDGDIFVTENQGAWIGACKLNHIRKGSFLGHPSSKPAPKKLYTGAESFDPPAVWFPYKLARSSSGMTEIKDDRFGPYKGQLLVGDFQNAIVTRVQLEKVGGEWQGAVWPFLKGFLSGVNRMAMGPDGNLYVGGCKTKAWAAVAPMPFALERVKFNGNVPFEVRSVRAMPDGFELTFTKPVDPKTAGVADGYDVWQYKLKYHSTYGSPEFDHDGKPNSLTVIEVKSARVSKDRRKVRLVLDGWKVGYVTAVRALDVRGGDGEKPWHDTFYYTLNQIPKP